MTRAFSSKIKGKKGQAVLEYILMALVVLSIASALAFGLRRIAFKVWFQMACRITAPCPHCQPLPDIKAVANKAVNGSCN